MNKYEENVYKNLFEYPTKKIVELELENEKLKKQKDDVVEYIKSVELGELVNGKPYYLKEDSIGKDLLRMLGEIDNE